MATIPMIDAAFTNIHPQLELVESRIQTILAQLPGLASSAGKRRNLPNEELAFLFAQLVLWSAELGAGPTEMSIDIAAAVELIFLSNQLSQSIDTIQFSHYLLCQGLSIASRYGTSVLDPLLETVTDVIKGLMDEQLIVADPAASPDQYLEHLYHKMAGYTATCCKLGAISTEAAQSFIETITSFGFALGMALQIKIDLMNIIKKEALHYLFVPMEHSLTQRLTDGKKQHRHSWDTYSSYLTKANACLSSLPESMAKQELRQLLRKIEMTPCFKSV